MSNPNDDAPLPFFAHLLNGQADPAAGNGDKKPTPSYPCIDEQCTKKYPSDDDESTTWINDRD